MFTDIRNLGPPMKATPDLKSSKGDKSPMTKDKGDSRSDSFEQTFSDKLSRRAPEKMASSADKPPANSSGARTERMRPPDQAEKPESRETRIENKIDQNDRQDQVDAVTVTKGDGKTKGLSERQRVMQNFMDSMESEFGIPPQRIVEAMAQLPDDKLLSSPEETAADVISQLDLSPKDSQKAESLYLGFLAQLSGTLPQVRDPQPLSNQQKVMMGAGGLAAGAMAPKLLSSRERREALNQSLDQMNSKFFIKPTGLGEAPMSMDMAEPQMNSDLVTPKSQALSQYQNYQPLGQKALDLSQVNTPLKDLGGAQPPLGPPQAVGADPKVLEQMSEADDSDGNAQLLKELVALGAAAGALSQAVKEDPKNAQALKMEQSLQGAGASGQSAMQQLGEAKTGESSMNNGKGKEQSRNEAMASLTAAPTLSPQAGGFFVEQSRQELPKVSSNYVGAPVLAGGKTSEHEASVQQVLNQTQYLIKKGGGEASVTMSPEGMGQVHLKVLVNEGKVNVQMQTETVEAKKAIEGSLNDLKTSLNTHRLAIDHVKVDVGNQLASDNRDQQQKMDFRQDPGREQARQFLGQFREDNLNNRDGFYEASGIKAYSKTQPTDPIKRAENAKADSIRRYQGSGKGAGLDLVA